MKFASLLGSKTSLERMLSSQQDQLLDGLALIYRWQGTLSRVSTGMHESAHKCSIWSILGYNVHITKKKQPVLSGEDVPRVGSEVAGEERNYYLKICKEVKGMSMTRAQAVDSASGKGLVRFRMDETLKSQAESALEQMGLSMANVMTMLSRRIVAEGKLPFEIYAVSTPLELTERAVMEGRAIMKSRKSRFGSVEELFNEIAEGAGERR